MTRPVRFFAGAVALTLPLVAIRFGCFDDYLSVNAAPTDLVDRFTILDRFFSGTVALTISLPAIRRGGLEDLSIDAAPTRRRRWRRRVRRWRRECRLW
jgi:hypothetical protein